jgi:hypothetical protein
LNGDGVMCMTVVRVKSGLPDFGWGLVKMPCRPPWGLLLNPFSANRFGCFSGFGVCLCSPLVPLVEWAGGICLGEEV